MAFIGAGPVDKHRISIKMLAIAVEAFGRHLKRVDAATPSNMRKPLSIGMFIRARFKTGLFRFPSGGPAHAARLVDACLAS